MQNKRETRPTKTANRVPQNHKTYERMMKSIKAFQYLLW